MAHRLVVALAAGILFSATAAAQSGQPSEYEVKSAFLFNFTKFVEWPEAAFDDARSPIVLGIMGEDPFGASLARIANGQKVQGRGIAIRRYRFGDDVRHCHVLFVSASERAHVAEILSSVQTQGVLTVSDLDRFAESGGVMQFLIEDNRVRFLVNLDAATQARLRLSAKLLALARGVINRTEVRKDK